MGFLSIDFGPARDAGLTRFALQAVSSVYSLFRRR